MSDVQMQALLSAVRSLLIAAGASLAAKGLIDSTTWNQVVGAIMTILPIAWGIWDKYRSESATKAREAVAVQAGAAAQAAGVVVAPPAPPPPPQPVTPAEIIKQFAPPAPSTTTGVTKP